MAGNLDNGAWCCRGGSVGTYWKNSQSISVGCLSSKQDAPLAENQSWAESVTVPTAAPCPTSATTSGAATTSPSSAPAPTNQDQHASITGGAIAGIVIGALAGVALVAAGLWFFLSRRRRRPRSDADASGSAAASPSVGDESLTTKNNVLYRPIPAEADSRTRERPVEVDGVTRERPIELQG